MMSCNPFSPQLLDQALLYLICSAVGAFVLAPILTKILYKYKVTRRADYDFTLQGERAQKVGTPIMGGLLVIIVVTVITLLFNWERTYTYVPIGAMGISALLGAADDLMNIFGRHRRRRRSIAQTWTLVKVHHNIFWRIYYFLSLPWAAFRELTGMLGSHPGKGIQVHEKLILQFLAGAVVAWWIYFKLGSHWQTINLPFDGEIMLGWWIIPIIIFLVMFTANAVNIADGLDGLAGGSLLITFFGLTAVSWTDGRAAFTLLNATVVGALIAYTYFNIKPARFQMGDVGSLGLGTLLAVNAIAINKTLLIPLFGFIFYIEAISVIIQVISRRFFGKRFFKMAPLHHHFEFRGWNEEKIVMRFWLVHLFFVIIGVWLSLH